jgi:hypothetical protein
MLRSAVRRVVLTVGVVIFAATSPSHAVDQVSISPDIAVDLAGAVIDDHQVVNDDQMGLLIPLPLGAFVDRTDIDAYHSATSGSRLYSLDTVTNLGGGLIVEAADVVEFDGVVDTLVFDASAVFAAASIDGVGVNLDAVSVDGLGEILVSFDTTIDLGGGVIADDEDLVRFDGVTTFTTVFDGSLESIDPALDLDGAHYRASDGHLFLSFDGSGNVAGVDFEDEDILEFDSVGPTWTKFYDGSALHADLKAADVIAVPEPNLVLQLVPGLLVLTSLGRMRLRRRQPVDQ